MNAPVPPVNEPETLKQQNQYQASYNQSFSSQPHQVEQTELQQEQLQTGRTPSVTSLATWFDHIRKVLTLDWPYPRVLVSVLDLMNFSLLILS